MKRVLVTVLAFVVCSCSSTKLPPSAQGDSDAALTSSKWAAYPEYLEAMLTRAQAEWEKLIEASHVGIQPGARVTVRIRLSAARGQVEHLEVIKSSADAAGTQACLSAIYHSAPYGAWTAEMRKSLGAFSDIIADFVYAERRSAEQGARANAMTTSFLFAEPVHRVAHL